MRGMVRYLPVMCLGGALLALLAGLVGYVRGESRRELVLIEDVSASVLASPRPELAAYLQTLAPDRVIRIAAAAQPALIGDTDATETKNASAQATLPPEFNLNATDLSAAIELAATLPGAGRRRALLATDGRENRGDAALAARTYAQRMLLDTAALGGVPAPDARVEDFTLPFAAQAGQEVQAELSCSAATECAAELTIRSADGVVVFRQVMTLGPVARRIEARIQPTGAGAVEYEAALRLTVDGQSDRVPENDRARAAVWLRSAGAAFWIGGVPPPPLGALRNWRTLALTELTPGLLTQTGLLVLDDIPAGALAGRARLIDNWVRRGGALVVLGGEKNLSPGDWAGTPLQELLPVQPRPGAGLAVAFALDVSGSMGEEDRGRSKLVAAAGAVEAAVAGLGASDKAGLIAFSRTGRTLLPVQRADSLRIAAALRELSPAGGTSLFAGAAEALRLLTVSGLNWRKGLIVLVTDGETAEKGEELQEATVRLRAELVRTGVRLAIVAVGQKVDEKTLAAVAQGVGTLTRADWRRVELPQVLRGIVGGDDAQRWAQMLTVTLPTTAKSTDVIGDVAHESVVRSLLLGPLRGREEDRVLLAADNGDALAAGGRYGLGRVVVLGGAPGREWGAAGVWFWRALVRDLDGNLPQGVCRAGTQGAYAEISWLPAHETGGPYRAIWQPVGDISGVIAGAGGGEQRKTLALIAGADGVWRAAALRPQPGLYRLRIESLAAMGQDRVQTARWDTLAEGAWSVSDRAEFLSFGPDGAALERIALAGGGRLLFSPAQLPAWEDVPLTPGAEPLFSPLLAALALFLTAAGWLARGLAR